MEPVPLHAWLRGAVADLLDRPAAEVDPAARFAELGLDSLRATQLAAALSRELGAAVPVSALWAYPSVDALAAFARDGAAVTSTAVTSTAATADEPIAVIGMACRFPSADDPEGFWDLLRDGVDAVRPVPAHRWPTDSATMATDQAALLAQPLDEFDPLFFEISPREAQEMDPQQRLFLEVAWEALENAGVADARLAGSRTGVFAGAIWRDYADLAGIDPERTAVHSATGRAVNMIANRVSYALGLRGPSVVVDTACSASLFAIHTACQSLRLGESTMAVAGGVNLLLSPATTVALTRFGGLSPDGRCKSFDARADGYGRGEGCGVVVLKPLSRALADGDEVWCVIAGSAANNDGLSNGLTAPNPLAQQEVLRDAYANAGVAPADVHYLETHGTGTQLGDPIEAAALGAVLGAGRERPLVIGSVKSNIGHLEGAAGVAGLIKAALCLRHREIPGNLHFERPNPHIAFDDLGLRVPVAVEPWPQDRPAVAGVSSFGWGGTNVHVVLRGWYDPVPAPRPVAAPVEAPRVAFVCSPHGQQWAGMGRDLFRAEPEFRAAIVECDAALAPHLGWSVRQRMFAADDGAGDAVDIAQPMAFAIQYGIARWLDSCGIRPDAVVGACFAEITAAVLAGVLDLADGARLVHLYSSAQAQVAGTGGGMAAIELPAVDLARFTGPDVVVAAEYGPRSSALSGSASALGAVLDVLKAEGVRCAMVRIDVAVHSPQLDRALAQLRAADVRPRPGRIPMISTVTGEPVDWRAVDGDYFAENLRSPIRLRPAVEWLSAGHGVFVEISANPILSSALRQTVPTAVATMSRDGAADPLGELAALGLGAPAAERDVLFTLSARSLPALRERASRVATTMTSQATPAPDTLADFAAASARRGDGEHRLAVVGRSTAEVATALAAFGADGAAAGVRVGAGGTRPKIAFVFPGQGSQWLGMGRDLLRHEPAFHAALRRVDAEIAEYAGWSVLDELTGPGSAMDRIDVVQPTLFAVEVALAQLWRSWGITPDAVVGHSMGEVAAAHVAGAISLADAVRIICGRSALLRGVSGRGAMLACELTVAQANSVLSGYEHAVSVAVNNSPYATVLSGDPDALREIAAGLASDGVFHRWVKVDVASHSPQMDPLREDLLELARPVSPRRGQVPVYSTVTGRVTDGADLDAGYWVDNLREPVLFGDQVRALLDAGTTAFVEISPHPILLPAVEQVIADAGAVAEVFPSLRRAEPERATMLDSLGGLTVLGVPSAVRTPGRLGTRLPAYPWQRERYWLDHIGAPGAPRGVGAGGHPVLGERLDSPIDPGTSYWQRAHNEALDGAGVMEVVLAAVAETFPSGVVELVDLTARPVGPGLLQTVVLRTGEHATVRVFARDGADTTEVASAAVEVVPSAGTGRADIATAFASALREVAGEGFGCEHIERVLVHRRDVAPGRPEALVRGDAAAAVRGADLTLADVEGAPLVCATGITLARNETRAAADPAGMSAHDALCLLDLDDRPSAAELMVRECVAEVAKLPAARIDPDGPLKALGIDSIMSLELRNRLEKRFGTRLSATVVWNYPTTRELAPMLLDRIGVPVRSAAEPLELVAEPAPAAGGQGLTAEELLDREIAELHQRLETI
ncbi:phthiocerol/phenolphthiocerol synthesis type-I polyketide synthase A [Actinokineospora baliensis]|uniref:type I polyketide synthase n=1 Tax=Actinokineospora baliensis TaxID=547056 RepID=UPI00195C1F5C|nr:type I polyketide synthase [Actinokineospora baliensis]MBM7776026.1 phthiocerol/phenolphthiocerol synthesis type-I polyketide synthase A [Actinokineospora baliensis]